MDTPSNPSSGLRIGFVPGVTLTKWRRIWEERFPRVPLEVLELTVPEQRRALVDDAVDMCFVRLPVSTEGLHAIPLYDEVPVAWMSKDHELTVLDELTAEDLADVRVIDDAEPESIELASYSAAVLRVPMSVARSGSRRDMVYRPVVDAPPTTVALAWRADNDSEWIEEFIGVVRGRTVNSSRSARERGDEAKPAEKARKATAPGKTMRPPARGRRPRRR
ncbi:LysR substrate-binding domain-containing protein [Tessaracoccus sp. G1721]